MRPYLKWVGNKAKLLKHLLPVLPQSIGVYKEPFCGSAAMFFSVADVNNHDLHTMYNASCFVLRDSNVPLINCHLVVRDHLHDLSDILTAWQKEEAMSNDRKALFDARRMVVHEVGTMGSDILAAARFIYVNRRCYGGMWRENSSGKYNVPFCDGQNSPLLNKHINKCSRLFRETNTTIVAGDYQDVEIQDGDFFFLDPPYYPLSKSSSFTSYAKDGWKDEDHEKFCKFCLKIHSNGGLFVMTNNDTRFFRDRLGMFNIESVGVHRFIDATTYHKKDGDRTKEKREIVQEMIVRNFANDGKLIHA